MAYATAQTFDVPIAVADWGTVQDIPHTLTHEVLGSLIPAISGFCAVESVWVVDAAGGVLHPEVSSVIEVINPGPSPGVVRLRAYNNAAAYIALGVTPVSYLIRLFVQEDVTALGIMVQPAGPTPLGPAMWEYGGGGGGGLSPTIFRPVGCHDVDDTISTLLGITPATEEVSQEARALYIGRALAPFTVAAPVVDVVSTAATDWCEVGICKGNPVLCDGPSNLTLIGYADTTGDWSVPGPVKTTIGGIAIAAGDHLWLAWSVKATGTTMPAFRPCLPDGILGGLFVFANTTRLSTMAPATAFNRCGSAERGMRSTVGCT